MLLANHPLSLCSTGARGWRGQSHPGLGKEGPGCLWRRTGRTLALDSEQGSETLYSEVGNDGQSSLRKPTWLKLNPFINYPKAPFSGHSGSPITSREGSSRLLYVTPTPTRKPASTRPCGATLGFQNQCTGRETNLDCTRGAGRGGGTGQGQKGLERRFSS